MKCVVCNFLMKLGSCIVPQYLDDQHAASEAAQRPHITKAMLITTVTCCEQTTVQGTGGACLQEQRQALSAKRLAASDQRAADVLWAALEAGKLRQHDGDVVGARQRDDLHRAAHRPRLLARGTCACRHGPASGAACWQSDASVTQARHAGGLRDGPHCQLPRHLWPHGCLQEHKTAAAWPAGGCGGQLRERAPGLLAALTGVLAAASAKRRSSASSCGSWSITGGGTRSQMLPGRAGCLIQKNGRSFTRGARSGGGGVAGPRCRGDGELFPLALAGRGGGGGGPLPGGGGGGRGGAFGAGGSGGGGGGDGCFLLNAIACPSAVPASKHVYLHTSFINTLLLHERTNQRSSRKPAHSAARGARRPHDPPPLRPLHRARHADPSASS